ncbi:MAG: hypothetical protein KAV48_02935 [Methanomicrobia archaeon]|nr:hypothetical protein [Methanomicrobia archaeon]
MKHQSFLTPRCKIFVDMYKSADINKEKCVVCKGRLFCGLSRCPILAQIKVQKRVDLDREFFGPSPSLFVGWKNYPYVNYGPLSLPFEDDAVVYDNPSLWYGEGFNEIITYRSSLIRSMEKVRVDKESRIVEDVQEIVLSERPVDIEVTLKKKPRFRILFSAVSQPMGPLGTIEELKITENPKISQKVDRVVNDEIKTEKALSILYTEGYDVYALTRFLSSGALGIEKKIVPTRWSITAVDDIVGKNLIAEIKEFRVIDKYVVLSNSYLGNHFEILLIPKKWEFEVLEAWIPDTFWTMGAEKITITSEYETYFGRKEYAMKQGGGYYAIRLGVLERLRELKRQACALVFREVTPDYFIPVGVWECRENVRNAQITSFETLKEALEYIKSSLSTDFDLWKGKSAVLNQKTLESFF